MLFQNKKNIQRSTKFNINMIRMIFQWISINIGEYNNNKETHHYSLTHSFKSLKKYKRNKIHNNKLNVISVVHTYQSFTHSVTLTHVHSLIHSQLVTNSYRYYYLLISYMIIVTYIVLYVYFSSTGQQWFKTFFTVILGCLIKRCLSTLM